MESQCTGYRAMSYWEDRRANRTQAELGKYPTGCRGILADAAWLSCLGIKWDLGEGRPTKSEDQRQAYLKLKEQLHGSARQREATARTEKMIGTRKGEWLKRFGPQVTGRLEKFIRRSLEAGKLAKVSRDDLPKVFEELEAETARKIEEHRNSIKWTGYDPAIKGADKTAYQLVDKSGKVIRAKIVGKLSDWVCLSLPEGEHWYLARLGSLLPATPQETSFLNSEWKAHTRLQQSKPDDRDLELPWV
jgi:hypothetical protein